MALLDILKKKKGEKTETQSAGVSMPMSGKKQAKVISTKNITEKSQDIPKKQKTITPKKLRKYKGERFSHVIIRPRITEKASLQSGGNSYTFNVARRANKIEIKKAVEEVYGVEPVKVNIINMKQKRKIVRGTKGVEPSFKKAVVFLKDGDSIEFV